METKYITLENAYKAVDARIEELEEKHGSLRPSTRIGVWGVKQHLIDIPVESVKPIIHAYWTLHLYTIRDGFDCWGKTEYKDILEYECSNCDEISQQKTKYCPNCGADMEKLEAF